MSDETTETTEKKSTTETESTTPAPESTSTTETETTTEPPKGKVQVDEDELNRLRRKVADADKAEKARKRKEDEEAGRHSDVVKGVEDELAAEKSKREGLEGEIEGLKKGTTVTTVAGRLEFNDPADALLHLPADTPNDEAAIERALKKVAKEKPYLVGGQGSRTGAPGGVSNPPKPADLDEQIREAEKKGDVSLAIRLKNQKALAAQS